MAVALFSDIRFHGVRIARYSRVLFNGCCGVGYAAVLAQLALSLAAHEAAWAGFCLLGLSDGLFWSSLPVVSNRVFGLQHSGGKTPVILTDQCTFWITFSKLNTK
eukprot:COSAG05_NODE_818_length_7136_cov_1156.705841_5_plen_105_part_00